LNERLAGFIESFQDESRLFLIARNKANQELIGYVYAAKESPEQDLGIYILSLYHGTGLADALIEKALDWINKDQPISFEVVSYNERAISFYEKHEFQKIANSERVYLDCLPVLKMIKYP
jgi:ribosomal protein S18 acetylase RimI-like enzyme